MARNGTMRFGQRILRMAHRSRERQLATWATTSTKDNPAELGTSQSPTAAPSSTRRMQGRAFNDIPTARRLPVVGTKLDFVLAGAGKKLHTYIDHRHSTLGPIFRECLGPDELVFVNCPSAMRELFNYEGKHPKHPLPESWTIYNRTHNCKRGLFFMDNEEWLQNRQIMNTLMLHADSQPAVRHVIWQSCVELVSDLDLVCHRRPDNDTEAFVAVPDLINILYKWSVRGVSAVVLGDIANTTMLRRHIDELSGSLHRLFENSAPLMSFPPQLAQTFRLPIWTEFEQTVAQIMRMANQIADIALQQMALQGAAKQSNSLIAGMLRHGMSVEMIKRIFIDLILAAGDTTAYTTQWAMYLLARNSVVQQEVREDVWSNADSLESPLVRGSVRETMRLYPMAFFIGRLMHVDAVIANFEVPKNTMVLASLYTAGRSSENFPSPNEFCPSRWSRDSDGKYSAVHRPGASLPYALGARSCIGKKLANTQMHYLLTSILRVYELKLLNDQEVDVEIKMVMVPSTPIRIGVRKCVRTDRIDIKL